MCKMTQPIFLHRKTNTENVRIHYYQIHYPQILMFSHQHHYIMISAILLSFFMDNCFGILLFSAKHQRESALGIHMSLPSWTSLPSLIPSHPSRLLQSTCLSSLSQPAKFPSTILFYIWYCKFPCYSLHTTYLLLPHLPTRSLSLFTMSVFPLVPFK